MGRGCGRAKNQWLRQKNRLMLGSVSVVENRSGLDSRVRLCHHVKLQPVRDDCLLPTFTSAACVDRICHAKYIAARSVTRRDACTACETDIDTLCKEQRYGPPKRD